MSVALHVALGFGAVWAGEFQISPDQQDPMAGVFVESTLVMLPRVEAPAEVNEEREKSLAHAQQPLDPSPIEPPPEPTNPLVRVTLGSADSVVDSEVWQGFADTPVEHTAKLSEVTQAGLSPFAGVVAAPEPAPAGSGQESPTTPLSEEVQKTEESAPTRDEVGDKDILTVPVDMPTSPAADPQQPATPEARPVGDLVPAPAAEFEGDEAPVAAGLSGVDADQEEGDEGARPDLQGDETESDQSEQSPIHDEAPVQDEESMAPVVADDARNADVARPESHEPGDSGPGGTGSESNLASVDNAADGAGEDAIKSEKEAVATSVEAALKFRPGRPLAGRGLEITTVNARFTKYAKIMSRPRNPVFQITFARDGRVRSVKVVRSSGYSRDVDDPILTAMSRWTAKGDALSKLPADDPRAGCTVAIEYLISR